MNIEINKFLNKKIREDMLELAEKKMVQIKSRSRAALNGHRVINTPEAKFPGYFLRTIFEVDDRIFPDDLILWLSIQDIEKKFYWAERDRDFETVGLGHAELISGMCNSPEPSHTYFDILKDRIENSMNGVRYYGAAAFNPYDKRDKTWDEFGCFYFFVPAIEFIKDEGIKKVAANIFIGEAGFDNLKEFVLQQVDRVSAIIKKLSFESGSANFALSANEKYMIDVLKRTDNPDRQQWIANVRTAIDSFSKTQLKKIVLARKSIFEAKEVIKPFKLLQGLVSVNVNTFNFCFQVSRNTAFLGCSPELLFLRNKDKLYTEAIAGTVVKGSNPEEEKKFESNLLHSKKDCKEYNFVFESTKENLGKICSKVEASKEKTVLKLSYAQHILSRLYCTLAPGAGDKEITGVLHPTPAVGGFPKSKVIDEIEKYETFSRGMYAGPVGWIGKGSSEFVVGIRTGLVMDNTISLFSGAGIVGESVPEMEWEEIENKINPFLKYIKFLLL